MRSHHRANSVVLNFDLDRYNSDSAELKIVRCLHGGILSRFTQINIYVGRSFYANSINRRDRSANCSLKYE